MKNLAPIELWYVTGSQHLYGEVALKQVAENSRKIVEALNASGRVSVKIVHKPVMTGPAEIRNLVMQANSTPECGGLILWMHTFSPSKMWIGGLTQLNKPFLHLATQFNRDLPWDTIDMDFMNLNQAAHGDREAGFIHTRLRLGRKVVVGHWSDTKVQDRIDTWARAARAWHDLQGAKLARYGDNMREVAVTEGDKVAAEIRFGLSVNGFGVGDLVKLCNEVSDTAIDKQCQEYMDLYDVVADLRKSGSRHQSLKDAARYELGFRAHLEGGNFKALTTTFEDLHGLNQLPGFACQRLMADGYGFGGEGDWKTSALVRAVKVMAHGKPGGVSFMEDYTYHIDPANPQVLGSHMLEICPSIAKGKPKVEIHALGIGGTSDPVRLVFDAPAGRATNVTLVDLGNRFRLLVNEVEAVDVPPMPKLPVARTVWKCLPDFQTAVAAWIYAGGAHHTAFSYAVGTEHMEDFAEIAGVELAIIDGNTDVREFRQTLRTNEVYYHLSQGFSNA
ncbi:MAG: arabinose isomerase [Phycisphaerales bacterium]|nr:arabinose isomerase [Phycisphaerales bacterium]